MLSRIVLFSAPRPALAALAVLLAGIVAGCGSSGPSGTHDRDAAVAAFYPIAYAVEQVAGARIDVRNLTPAGAEPHDLELTAGDVQAVDDATIVLYLGDGFMPALEAALEERSGRSVDLLTGVSLRPAPGEDEGSARDPHVWLDPVRYAAMVRTIGKTLGDASAAEPLARRLAALDREFRRSLALCERRQIVTSHAAFGYLAHRYGLEQVSLEGVTPEAEPSARSLARLVDLVRQSGATTVFFETLVSPKLARTVAREAGVSTAVLNPLEGLTGDEVAAGEDYFSVMRANLAALRKALGCTIT